MKPNGQEIQCVVENCKYNQAAQYCTLSSIMVGECCNSAQEAEETECASFEAK